MAELYKTTVTLRFLDDDLNPDEISAGLGATSTVGLRKGDRHLTPNGKEVVARTGMWHLRAKDSSPGNLQAQIHQLLTPLSSDLDVWRQFSSRYNGHVFVGLFICDFNEGLSLDSETVYSLASRGLALDFDIYQRS